MAGGDLESAVLAELRDAGKESTSAGQAALALARRVDAGAEQAAPLVRQMHDSMDRVLKAQAGKTALERMRERRGA